jgi:hypothetical protein
MINTRLLEKKKRRGTFLAHVSFGTCKLMSCLDARVLYVTAAMTRRGRLKHTKLFTAILRITTNSVRDFTAQGIDFKGQGV